MHSLFMEGTQIECRKNLEVTVFSVLTSVPRGILTRSVPFPNFSAEEFVHKLKKPG